MATPTKEPESLRVGDTWTWRRDDLSDYPASTWTLTYYFRNASAHFDVIATADGDAFAVTVAKATTAARTAGIYGWLATVSDGTSRFEVDGGQVTLLPDYGLAAALDDRSFAAKLLAAVEAELTSQGSSGQLGLVTAALDNRSLTRDHRGLITLRSQLVSDVQREQAVAATKRDGVNRNRLMVRFG
jgi:hypothetical protein